MSFSPIAAGDASILHCTFTVDGGGAFSLAGLTTSNLSMHYVNSSGTPHIGTGTWTITNATAGTADYAPSAADVATADTYKLYPVLSLTTGPKAFDPQMLVITNQP